MRLAIDDFIITLIDLISTNAATIELLDHSAVLNRISLAYLLRSGDIYAGEMLLQGNFQLSLQGMAMCAI